MSQDEESKRFLQLLANKYFSKTLNAAALSGVDSVVVLGQGGALQERLGQDIWLPGGSAESAVGAPPPPSPRATFTGSGFRGRKTMEREAACDNLARRLVFRVWCR